MTAYNVGNKLARAFKGGRQIVADPGSAGTIKAKQQTPAVCVVTGGSARSLEVATRYGVGDSLLIVSQTSSITVQSVALAAGDFVLFEVTLDSAGTKVWSPVTVGGGGSYNAPITDFYVWDAVTTRLPSGAGTNDDLGILTGTFLTDAPKLSFNPGANPTAVSQYARIQIPVPASYRPGKNLTLNVTVTQTTAGDTVTIDAQVVRAAAPTVDICATNAQSAVGASLTVKSFTLTGTTVVPGDVLDIRLQYTATSDAETPVYKVDKVELV